MPLVEIHMSKGRTEKQKKALLDGVTEAVRDSLGVPLTSIRVWIQEFSPKDFMIAGKLYAERKK
jgi:4-oxalocrotonate tautomerase family enzyme